MAILEAKHIRKDYNTINVISDLSLEVQEGDFTVLVGPSGCGKSTLLRMIAGLEDITAGDLLIDGRRANDLHPRERGISMVFQSYALYPHMSVHDNIGFGLKLEGKTKQQITEAVREVADTLQLTEYLDRKPSQLSGGQRQRVAIGRAIVRKPRIILFDEPLSNLDAKLRVEMRMELMKFHRSHNITTIYVTHDQVEAITMADRIAVLEKGDIRQYDTPRILFDKPANPFVASFIGSPQMNLFGVSSATDHLVTTDENAEIRLPDASMALLSDAAVIGVRPEHLKLKTEAAGTGLNATVDLVENLGDESVIHLLAGDQRITARSHEPVECEIGQSVFLGFDTNRAHFFDDMKERLD
ncbi:maltose/maltodextrin import ATP-binding protein MalK [Roseibium sp. TrichSKD4]|uniref:ABC transporter ATP-binding protein n=1 Tax=Roseibium sp. TrichSKD4 TaxID=744980 RepID=UPI0001E575B1|nr:sn-glycerol-3-phosphate ABC transporter ATP-binding protein UgpC [Roseibium sp. TrichSKD4]EFO29388.1 maltose/maltodextrin import ATP-binding protein MalK [Roseibium sp. TrichSKD4]